MSSTVQVIGVGGPQVRIGPLPVAPIIGTGIIFGKDVSLSGGTWEIFNCAPDGSGLTQLTSDTNDYATCVWSPTGDRILAVSQTGHVWIMLADGTGATEITNCQHGSGLDDDQGAWSPDGTQIALPALSGGDIQIVNADNSGFSVVSVADHDFSSSVVYWSPDGTKFAFNDGNGTHGGVSVCHTDGSSETHVAVSAGTLGYTVNGFYADSTNLLIEESTYSGAFPERALKMDGTTTTVLYNDPTGASLGGYTMCLNASDETQVAWRNADSTAGVTTLIGGVINDIGPGTESIGPGVDWR